MNKDDAKYLALGMAALCVQNTCFEDLHKGEMPVSSKKDFSDVKVVTPSGEIPWKKLSRIDNEEMRRFMKEVIDKIYSVLLRMEDSQFIEQVRQYGSLMDSIWDEPQDTDLLKHPLKLNK